MPASLMEFHWRCHCSNQGIRKSHWRLLCDSVSLRFSKNLPLNAYEECNASRGENAKKISSCVRKVKARVYGWEAWTASSASIVRRRVASAKDRNRLSGVLRSPRQTVVLRVEDEAFSLPRSFPHTLPSSLAGEGWGEGFPGKPYGWRYFATGPK